MATLTDTSPTTTAMVSTMDTSFPVYLMVTEMEASVAMEVEALEGMVGASEGTEGASEGTVGALEGTVGALEGTVEALEGTEEALGAMEEDL